MIRVKRGHAVRTEHQSVSLSVFRGASKGGQDQRDGQTDGADRLAGRGGRSTGRKKGGEKRKERAGGCFRLCVSFSSVPLYCMSIYVTVA